VGDRFNSSLKNEGERTMHLVKRFNLSVGLGLIFWGMLSCLLPSTPASAALLQFSFTGAVNNVPASLFPAINNGQTLFGSITIDTSVPDSNPSPVISLYSNAISSLTLSLGPMTAALGLPDNSIRIHEFTTFNRYRLEGPLSGSSVNGLSPIGFRFVGDALPSAPPSLSSFISNQWRLIFDGPGHPTVRGSLTSLTAVPLPAAVILFGAGFIALVGLGAGSWRQRKTSLA
jgi:hypothetical protein